MSEQIIENKVANSGLITIDLEEFYSPGERVVIDLKDYLFRGLILREKDFRDFVKSHDWKSYQNKFVAVFCSADAVIPTWAYMLVSAHLQPFAKKIVFGNLEVLENQLYRDSLALLDVTSYQNCRLVIKGCSKIDVPAGAYLEITRLLTPVVKSIMFGEPCSTVPVWKNKDNRSE